MANTSDLGSMKVGLKFDTTELQAGLTNISKKMSVLDSEIKSGTSGFTAMGKSSDALKTQITGLTDKITLQKERVALLKAALDTSIATKGEDAVATQNLQIKYNNASTQLNKFQIDLKDTNSELIKQPNLFNKMQDAMEKVSSKMATMGKTLTVSVTAPLVALATLGVKYNADMEQYQAGLETMLGSADKATSMLLDLKTMANKTPFETTDLIKASQTMLAFGMSSGSTMSALSMLGDVSMGNKDKLNSLTLAFAQVQSTGKLMGQDLLQMVGQGFNPLQIISEKTGRSMSDLKDDMSDGAISADMVTEAFKTATSEGGRFYGAMDKQSQTMTGKLSTLKDAFSSTLGELTTTLLPTITKIMDKLSQLVGWFSKLDEGSKSTILTFVGLAIAAGPIISVLGFVSSAIGVLSGIFATITTAITLLAWSLNLPVIAFVGIIAAIVAVGVAIFVFRDQIWDFLKGVGKGIVDFISSIPEMLSGLLKIIVDFIVSIPEKIAYGLGFIIGTLSNFFTNITIALSIFISNIPKSIEMIVKFFWELPGKIWSALLSTIGKIGEFIGNMANNIASAMPGLINNFVNYFTGLPDKVMSIGKNIVDGLLQGIKNSWNNLTGAVGKMVDSFVKGIKDGLGIHSPSKILADEVGQWIPKGIAVGIDANTDSVSNSLNKVKSLAKNMNMQYEYGLGAVNTSRNTTNTTVNSPINLNIANFNNTRSQDIKEVVTEMEYYRKQVAYAKGGVA